LGEGWAEGFEDEVMIINRDLGLLSHVSPHPDPLPKGEGTFSAAARILVTK